MSTAINMKNIITNKMVRYQSYKFYLAPLLFFSYVAIFPYCYEHLSFGYSLIIAVFPGALLYSWICFLLHESWHKYVPNVPNQFLFNLYSWLLAADPQIYRIAHGTHHAHTHTWHDLEFYPIGKITNPYLRRFYNLLHFMLGQVFIYHISLIYQMAKHPKFRWHRYLSAFMMIVITYASLFYISHHILNVSTFHVFIGWVMLTIVGGSIQHHSQLIEHWGIIAEDKSLLERNLLSRNLKSEGLIEKFFLFLTHWDSHEHVLHHLHPRTYTRPFLKQIPMPSQSVHINFKEYLGIAWRVIMH